MSEHKQSSRQTFLAGALTGSAGVFLSKAIGLFYVVPFTAIAGEENMAFYSAAFTYYDILLQICSAGLPFAVAAIVAKYANRNDYKTVLLVRKLSASILTVSGLIMAVLFAVSSGWLSKIVLGTSATAQDLATMRTTFFILSLALFLVPILYSYRGFYQGFKEMKAYAFSQVLEQVFRVACLLGIGWVLVYVLQLDKITAIYAAVLSTSLGALAAIFYFVRFDHQHYGEIARAARSQETRGRVPKQLLLELLGFGIPYLISSLLGNTQNLINTNFFISVNTSLGMAYEQAKLLYGIIQVQCAKLISIPQVLSIGFSAGLVPYMTIAMENHDRRALQKTVLSCLDSVFYIAMPICVMMFFLAEPIYYIMYGNANLSIGAECLRWSSMLALASTISPICTSTMMTLRLHKQSIIYLLIGFAVKCISFYPLIRYTGYTGAITSSILTSLVIIFLDLGKIKNRYGIRYARTWKRLFRIIIGCLCMNGAFALLKMTPLNFQGVGRVGTIFVFAVYAVIGLIVYFYITSMMHVPQCIFGMNRNEIISKILRTIGIRRKQKA